MIRETAVRNQGDVLCTHLLLGVGVELVSFRFFRVVLPFLSSLLPLSFMKATPF